jgi:two-component system, NarL family, sensor histidine kinase UhpB
MSLRSRLIALVCAVLWVSLAIGGMIAYGNASRSVRTEMRAALLVGRQTIESGLDRLRSGVGPSDGLEGLIASFRDNRHLRVRLNGEEVAAVTPTIEHSPFGSAPTWFVRVVGVAPMTEQVPVVLGGHNYGTIAIETDPHNELLEVWNEFTDSLVAPGVFCGLTILLIYVFVGRTLRPLNHLAAALEDIADGRYRTRISGKLAPELALLRDRFNRMATHLAEADAENRRLNERLLTLQEEERCELARDLHDELGPYLFAINVDAAAACRRITEDRATEAREHVLSIIDAARHTQQQVRRMLGRLRPIGLDEFGLREAIQNLVAFWRRRRPEICYEIEIAAECEDIGDILGTTICRVVQEALSNSVRHAEPDHISISIEPGRDAEKGGEQVIVLVCDDGRGTRESSRLGYGLIGLKERVGAVGGCLSVAARSAGGFSLTAVLPRPRLRQLQPAPVQLTEP